MTVRKVYGDGAIGPETIARMSLRDLVVMTIGIASIGLPVVFFLVRMDARLGYIDKRLERLEQREDARDLRAQKQ
jgi:hypothetical protein